MSGDLYARVRSENREGETLGETLKRLVNDDTLEDFGNNAACGGRAWERHAAGGALLFRSGTRT